MPAHPKKKGRPNKDEEERKKAKELAQRTGVPLWGAFRVVRGETSLNDLLKSMMRREQFDRLQKSGLDSDLAGHAASGSLPVWRARVLQEMRVAGRGKYTRDRIEMSHRDELSIAIWRFGEDWAAGRVTRAKTYDFDFVREGSDEPVLVLKHDVKMICDPACMEQAARAGRFDKKVVKLGLGSSRERADRYRPTDEKLHGIHELGKEVKWVFRDGTSVRGKVAAFGRWDADLTLEEGATVTLFFHALHPETDRYLGQAAG